LLLPVVVVVVVVVSVAAAAAASFNTKCDDGKATCGQWRREGEGSEGEHVPGRHCAGAAFAAAKIWNCEIWPRTGVCIAERIQRESALRNYTANLAYCS